MPALKNTAVETVKTPAPEVITMPNITITPNNIWQIKLTPVQREYQTETLGYAGKKYNIYAFNGKAFIAHEDDQFNADFKAGKVFKVELQDTELGYSLLAHQTAQGAITASRTQALVEYFSSANFTPTEKDFEDLG